MTDQEAQRHYLDVQPRRSTATAAHVRRSAWTGRIIRIGFFGGIVVLALALGWYLMQPDDAPLPPEPEPDAPAETEAGVVRMTNPRFSGRDNQGRPFQVLADTAIRRPQDMANITELDSPDFYFNSEGDNPDEGRVQSLEGIYDSDARVLDLITDVDMQTESGYAFRTSRARIYIDERRAEGNEPVEGEGPFGTVTAERWTYAEEGGVLHFEGNVRSVLNMGDGAEEDAGQ